MAEALADDVEGVVVAGVLGPGPAVLRGVGEAVDELDFRAERLQGLDGHGGWRGDEIQEAAGEAADGGGCQGGGSVLPLHAVEPQGERVPGGIEACRGWEDGELGFEASQALVEVGEGAGRDDVVWECDVLAALEEGNGTTALRMGLSMVHIHLLSRTNQNQRNEKESKRKVQMVNGRRGGSIMPKGFQCLLTTSCTHYWAENSGMQDSQDDWLVCAPLCHRIG